MHAAYALAGLDALDERILMRLLKDGHPRVREHAVRLSESFTSNPNIRDLIHERARDDDIRVRYQTAFTLGEFNDSRNAAALVSLLKDGKTIERLDHVGGIPLGIDPEWTYDDHTITLKPGQTLVLYTDGITEAMNTENRMFGTSGIEESLHHCTGEPDCTLGSINTALDQHTGGGDPDDDQTIVAMRID